MGYAGPQAKTCVFDMQKLQAIARVTVICLGTSALTAPSFAANFSVGGGTITTTQADNSTDSTVTGGPFALQPNTVGPDDVVTITGVSITNTSGAPSGRALDIGQTLSSSGSYSVFLHGSTLAAKAGSGEAAFIESSAGGNISFDSAGGASNVISGPIGINLNGDGGNVSIRTGADTVTTSGTTGEILYATTTGTGTIAIDTAGATLTSSGIYGISAETGGSGAITIGGLNGGMASTLTVNNGYGIYVFQPHNDVNVAVASSGTVTAATGVYLTGDTVTVNNAGSITASGTGSMGKALDFSGMDNLGTLMLTNSGTLQSTAGNAVQLGGVNVGVVNTGSILAMASGARALDMSPPSLLNNGPLTYSLVNGSATSSSALIQSDDDAVRINSVSGMSASAPHTIVLDNFGTIRSSNGQAIDFDKAPNAVLATVITNEATGIIRADNSDAIRPGGATVNNYGQIIAANTSGSGYASGNDGIDFSAAAYVTSGNKVNNFAGGTITGARNGITFLSVSTVNNDGTITGLDGSGVFLGIPPGGSGSGYFASIVNTGTITGNAVSADGDAIHSDYRANITNSGTVRAIGLANPASGQLTEAAVMSAGFLYNNAGGLIVSDQRAVTVDATSEGSNGYPTTIDNAGTITGGNGEAIVVTSLLANTLINRATGVINGNVVMGSGSDTVTLYAGSQLNGVVDGGAGNDTLNLTGSGTGTLPGAVSNFETLNVQGGNWTLSGVGGYATAVSVSGGATLNVTGTMTAPALTVASDATLSGTGKVGNTSIANGGILAPGSSGIGTLTVNGNLSMASGSVLSADISPSASDTVAVSGTSSIDGVLTANAAGGTYAAGQRYTLISAAGGISGTFASFTTPGLPGYVKGRLTYDANNAYLVLDANALTPLLPSGATGNQNNVAKGIDNAISGGAVLNGSFNALFGLSGSALANALDQISGRNAPNTATAIGQSFFSFLNGMQGQGAFASGETASAENFAPGSSYAGTDAPRRAQLAPGALRIWGTVYGGHAGISADAIGGSASLSASNVGFAAGAETALPGDLLVGGSVGIGEQNFASGNGSGDSRDVMLGLYGRKEIGKGYLAAAIGYGWHDISTTRVVTVSGTDILGGKFNANSFGGRMEAGYHVPLNSRYILSPFAAFAGDSFDSPSYAEGAVSGSSAFALSYAANTVGQAHTELGTHLARLFALGDGMAISADARLAWAHELEDAPFATATFQGLAASTYRILGVRGATDTALLGLDLQARRESGLAYGLRMESQIGSGTTVLEGMGTLAWHW